MFGLSCLALELTCKALLERNSDLATQIIDDDDEVDAMSGDLDYEGTNIIASYNPVSNGLRFIISLMRLTKMFERLSDCSVTICTHVLRLNSLAEMREVRFIEPVFLSMLNHANKVRKSFEERNFKAIRNCLSMTGNCDNLISLTNRLVKVSEIPNVSIPALAELIFISRSLQHIWISLGKIEEEILQLDSN